VVTGSPPIADETTVWASRIEIPYRASAGRSHSTSRKYPPVVRSANTLRVPRTPRKADSTCPPTSSIAARLGPKIFTPTGVLIPVASMSIRLRIGMTKALVTPGKRSLASSSDSSRSRVSPGRHAERGLSITTVSTIESGAGSVEVSARPAFPKTRSTSGTPFSSRSIVLSKASIPATETPGSVTGM